MKKSLAVLATLVSLAGCATLTSQGILTPEQAKAACLDATTLCVAVQSSGQTDETITKACDAIAKACASQPEA